MSGRYPDWAIEGKDWPNRAASRFVDAGGYRWHIQQMGEGPVCLLLHGTGAATHSWRDMLPLLAQDFMVVAADLPGHGFTGPNLGQKPSLEGISGSVGQLLRMLELKPDLVVGHSAGVAIAAQMLLDQKWQVPLVGFAPALMPFPGLAARIFPQLARLLFTNPFVSIIFSRMAAYPGETGRFLKRSTGSHLDTAGVEYYTRLFSKSGHCDGAIRMMANWRLEALQGRLGEFVSPALLVHPTLDSAIPASAVASAAALIPNCEQLELAGLGHLAHEEAPAEAAAIVTEFAKRHMTA
jgi:magnesium chelatase accessory protein